MSSCAVRSWCIGGALALVSGTTSAQQPDTVRRLAPVIVAGSRLVGASANEPSRVNILQLTTTVPGPAAAIDALHRLVGVSLFDDQGSRLQPELNVRGFVLSPVIGQPQGVSVFLDGVRINEPDAQEVNFDLIPMDAVDHAELIRGPNTEFGKNSLAGSLLLFTRRGDSPREVSADLDAGAFGYRRAHVDGGGRAGSFDGFFMAHLSDEDGWRQATGARTRMVFANIGRKREASDVALTVMYANDRLHQAGSLPESYLSVDRRLNYTPGDYFRPEVLHVALRGEHALAGGQLRGNVFARRTSIDQYNGNVPPPNSDGLVENRTAGALGEWTRTTSIGGIVTTMMLGTEYSQGRVDYQFFAVERPGIPASAPQLDALQCQVPSGLCTSVLTREDNGAMYAQALLAFTPAVSATLALRGDYVRLPITDRLMPENSGTNSYWHLSPKLGINVRPGDAIRGYVAFNTGFRAPAALELSCADAAAPCALPFALGADPPLRAVSVLDYEAGVDLSATARTTLSVSTFLSDVRNDILFVQPTATTGFFQNVARTRRSGVELSATAQLPAGLRAFGSYSYIDASYRTAERLASALEDEPSTQPGNRFPATPAQVTRVGLEATHAFRSGIVAGAIDVHGVSSQYLRGDEANAHAPLPGYALADGRLSAQLGRMSVHASVSNVFNRRYVSFGVYARNVRGAFGELPPSDPDDAPIERFLTPGQPRSLTVSVSVAR